MKKIQITRKHGYKARQAVIERWLCLQAPGAETAAAPAAGCRLKTQLTFERGSQSYYWTTDRGRSRLIKH